ncbi:MAG: hypothetical protein HYX75_09440 [Acidobacteria bacterium]|nr:hypothetical protein [Acidobacteriota bacterium]
MISPDIRAVLVAVAEPLLFGLIVFIVGTASPWFLLMVATGGLVGLLMERANEWRQREDDDIELRDGAKIPRFHEGPTMSRIAPEGGPGLVFTLGVVYMFLVTIVPDIGAVLFATLVGILAIVGAVNAYRLISRGGARST